MVTGYKRTAESAQLITNHTRERKRATITMIEDGNHVQSKKTGKGQSRYVGGGGHPELALQIMLTLTRNCRGLRNASTVASPKAFLRCTYAKIGFISGTTTGHVYSETILRRLGYQKYIIIPANGRSGGIWLCWDDDIGITVISTSNNLVHVKVEATSTEPEWELLGVYGQSHQFYFKPIYLYWRFQCSHKKK